MYLRGVQGVLKLKLFLVGKMYELSDTSVSFVVCRTLMQCWTPDTPSFRGVRTS